MMTDSLRGWAVPAVVVLVALVPPGLGAEEVEYEMTFTGLFHLYPLQGEDFTDELFFSGDGDAVPFGAAQVIGYSRTQNGPDGCATIVHDEVAVYVPGGSLLLVNEGTDCVDPLSAPGEIMIVGDGETEIVGGTGAYAQVRGGGTWSVAARVTGVGPGYLEGTFDELRFTGRFG